MGFRFLRLLGICCPLLAVTAASPPLTTVRQPLRAMGDTAARQLLAQLAGAPSPSAPLVVPTTLVIRESTAVVSVEGA